MTRPRVLLTFMLLYGTASLIHFVHNALYLDFYPNLPPWLTPLGVLASWLVVAGIGAAGYWLFRNNSPAVGLTTITCTLRWDLRDWITTPWPPSRLTPG